MKAFDIAGALPGLAGDRLVPSTTLLEASAGTGKTWTIAALVTRYLAEGHATIDEILAVTFTNAATSELRDRVRRRIDHAATALDHALTGGRPSDTDALVGLLLTGDRPELVRRRDRLRAALTAFDTATIVTIHQFCNLVLKGLGVAGDTDPRATLVEDLSDLRKEVVDDVWLRDHAHDGRVSYADAGVIAKAIVDNPGAHLAPSDPAPGSDDEARVAFARAVLHEFDVRKRRLGVLSYDDLLGQLRDALDDEHAVARARMRQRWCLVLIDEFQDTDPVQWDVFERAFHGQAVLVLIGDPKQAIYAFRGGDVFTYLRAAELASDRQTLSTNQRSDPALVASVHTILNGAQLGDPAISVHPIDAARDDAWVRGLPGRPFQLRTLTRADLRADADSLATVGTVNPRIAEDAATQIQAVLAAGGEVWDAAASAWVPRTAGHVAVLAHGRAHLELVQAELRRLKIPAVITGGQSVFATDAGREWRALLEAMGQPHRATLVRAAGATSFFGCSGTDLDAGGDDLTDRLADRVRELAATYTERGLAAVFEALVAAGLTVRVLATDGGERHLTDLRHLAELMHAAATRERLGLAGLVAWFLERQRETTDSTTERTRRIDSDAHAVQLVTIHGSKGLEYPVVLAPFLSNRYVGREKPPVLIYHDDQRERVVDVGDPARRPQALLDRHADEDAGESLRMLYVALTRARSRLIVWWAAGNNAPHSALNRVLLGRGRDVAEVPARHVPQPDEALVKWFARWDEVGGPEWSTATPVDGAPTRSTTTPPPLAVRTFSRTVDQHWRRTSYSALAAAADAEPGPAVGSEPEVTPKDDEPAIPLAGPVDHDPALDLASPLAGFPSGARFGSLVHAVLEHADPAAPDWRAELLGRVGDQLVDWPVELDPEALADGLVAVCDSPLGPLAGGATLRTVPMTDRLCELDFELPIGGGDDVVPGPHLLGDIAALLRRHLPADDPLRSYAAALDDPRLGDQLLVGYLTGSVDLVFRVRGDDGEDRYLICDYKTNWLGPSSADREGRARDGAYRDQADAPLTAADYTPDRLVEAMGHSSYPLQALLYAVVLHRYLRWRLPDYDPDRHLGGVLYLYLRGMCGPETPVVAGSPCGVFSWQPPSALVADLSDLLDGDREGAAR
jgi:exodeoxyribonuclease V beta subunit